MNETQDDPGAGYGADDQTEEQGSSLQNTLAMAVGAVLSIVGALPGV